MSRGLGDVYKRQKLISLQMRKEMKTLVLIFILGLAYACIVRYTSFCIPCFFNTITGLKCPGCGITHVFLSLMRFDLRGAYHANPFLLISSPVLLLIIILNFFCSIKIRTSSFTKWLTLLYVIAILIWGVVRNLIF